MHTQNANYVLIAHSSVYIISSFIVLMDLLRDFLAVLRRIIISEHECLNRMGQATDFRGVAV